MKRITITREQIEILCDDEDAEEIQKHIWYKEKRRHSYTTHLALGESGNRYYKGISLTMLIIDYPGYTHRIVFKDKDYNNFQKKNLEIVPKNRIYVSMRRTNRSGFRGVCWDKENNRWIAQISYLGKNLKLGRFKDIKDAALAYNKKALDLFGDQVYLNDVDSLEAKYKIDAANNYQLRSRKRNATMRRMQVKTDKHGKQLQNFIHQLIN